jgi:DNA-binding transcriptional MerR regulator
MLSIGDFARLAGVTTRTIRHYGDVGILTPASVDPGTGYRRYGVDQLADLRRVLVLRDLGLGLDQIREVLADDPSVEHLRGMLRLRRSEIAQSIAEEQERLRRVEAHLDAIERGGTMDVDVVLKQTDPLRVAVATARSAGWGFEHMRPVFESVMPEVWVALTSGGVRVGMPVALYEVDAGDDEPVFDLGFEIGDQPFAGAESVRVVEPPVIEVASTLIHGRMAQVDETFEAVLRWMEANGREFSGTSRELHLRTEPDGMAKVTELQLAVR